MGSENKLESECLFEDGILKIDYFPSASDKVVLCFTGVGHSLGGLDVQQPEFTGTGLKLGAPVIIIDKTRSWGNRLDFEQIGKIVAPVCEGKEILAIGNSMGAFLAIVASKYLDMRSVFAFAPQYSVSADIVPDEHRWMRYRDTITDYKIPSLEGHFVPTCVYNIFSGGAPEEQQHWSKFPVSDNVRSFILPDSRHNIAIDLKDKWDIHEIIAGCLAADFDAESFCRKFELTLARDFQT